MTIAAVAGEGVELATRILSKKFNLGKTGNLISGGMYAWMFTSGYSDARNNGSGVVGAIGSGVVDAALPDLIGMKKYFGFGALSMAPGAIVGAVESIGTASRSLARSGRGDPFQNAVFNDTQQAFTMRQAGMQLAERSKYNLQQTTLGNEARAMHR